MASKALSLTLLGIGIFILMQVALPYLAYFVWENTTLNKSELLADPNPVSADPLVSGFVVQNVGNFPAFIARDSLLPPPAFKEFKLSVPKLKLDRVTVKVNSNDFEDTLAHLPGTALPGEKGNIFISGHSSLSLASILESKKRKAIFISLPGIRKGDQIDLEVLGQMFVYEVVGLKVVDPQDISVINPPDREGRFLTLMTCVPPGFNTKRLIVLAKLKG